MSDPGEWRCDVTTLPPGHTAKFRFTREGRSAQGFVVNHEGRFHAYVNRCPHVGTPLDLWENEFLTEDGRTIVCATHGALFAPDTGLCIGGPCAGDRLTPLPVRLDGNTVVVRHDGQ
jgi:nitrite reductase/ring-hydroxylating ferredoxin subunit